MPLGPKMPFDRAVFGQWRCYWPFGGGMFTDLFVHQTTHMITAMGVRYPGRVVAGGGLYLEYDGRDVPDVATIVADYDEGCQLMITATMISAYPIEEVIRGRLGTIKFVKGGFEVIGDDPTRAARHAGPAGEERRGRVRRCTGPPLGRQADTEALWENFLECVRGQETRNAEHAGTGGGRVHDGGDGRAELPHRARRCSGTRSSASRSRPTPAGPANLEARSKSHGKPSQIIGWKAGGTGSNLVPPDYQKLAGPWKDGKDPAAT